MIPEGVKDDVKNFHVSLSDLETSLLSRPAVDPTVSTPALERAKHDLMVAYCANSLYWMYLCTKGEKPVEHAIKHELERIKKAMDRLKEIQDREKAPRLDKRAAKSFVRSAMWVPTPKPNDDDVVELSDDDEKGEEVEEVAATSTSQPIPPSAGRSKKRRKEESTEVADYACATNSRKKTVQTKSAHT